mgnify:CR=1 FL=1
MHPDIQQSDYRELTLLGEGGMGKVYRAFDTRLHRTVVIKVINDNLLHKNKDLVLREAQALAKVNHPNVMQVYRVIGDAENEGGIRLIGEYIDGEALAILQKQRVMSLEQKLEILRQICEGCKRFMMCN